MKSVKDVSLILDVLSRSKFRRYGAMTVREISDACGECRRASRGTYKALREMERYGLVRNVGSTLQNAHTWAITDVGRAIVAQKRHRVISAAHAVRNFRAK